MVADDDQGCVGFAAGEVFPAPPSLMVVTAVINIAVSVMKAMVGPPIRRRVV